ncbi:hypothetical protein ABID19_005932 [Mesorhizobium robiniae]|uniref:Uncharacterized protein n=1 Tax=Mesorhizobium robiniae TaxID=559315 RepID=A0ABV2GX43_9HYPH
MSTLAVLLNTGSPLSLHIVTDIRYSNSNGGQRCNFCRGRPYMQCD